MIVGFTGTRDGMTVSQKQAVELLLVTLAPTECHHGDCVGADADFHRLAWLSPPFGVPTIIHPGPRVFHGGEERKDHRAYCTDGNPIILPPKTHFARNRDIVDVSTVMIATPRVSYIEAKGGTSYTIGYARKKLRPLFIVWPNGEVSAERWP